MRYKCLFDFWMVTFNRIGMKNMRSSVHSVNGVYEDELLDMVSLIEGGAAERGNQL